MSFKDALSYLKPYRSKLYGIVAMAVVISIISFILPFLQQNLIDYGLVAMHAPTVVWCVCLLVGLHLVSRLVEYLQKHVELAITNGMGKSLKMDALKHGMRLKPHYFKEQGFYKTMGDALYDIQGIMGITESSFLTFAVIIFKTVGAAVALFLLDWRLALCVAVLIPIKLLLNTYTSRRAAKLNDDCVAQNKRYNSWFGDVIDGILDVKLWNLYERKRREYAQLVDGMNSRQKRLQLWSQMDAILTGSIEDVVLNGIYILGVYLMMGQHLTLGSLISFITFAGYLLTPVNLILHMKFVLRQIGPNLKSIKNFYELEEEDYAAERRVPEIHTITFDHVSLKIDGKLILQDVSFQIRQHEKIVITGENGSGKTTLLNLLLQLQEPTSGQIYFDDIPINQFNIIDYRRQFSVVTQDIHLFKGTIAENISMDDSEPQYEDIEKYTFCTEFINDWEDGYNTKVGVSGAKLSGGERQKIALLRALNRGARILILDEPTSSYDKESEAAFNQFVLNNENYHFVLIVSHRKEILEYVDRVINIENGQMVDMPL